MEGREGGLVAGGNNRLLEWGRHGQHAVGAIAPRGRCMVVPSRLRLTTINHISCCPPSATSRDFSYNCSQCTAFASTWLHLHLWPS